MSYTIDASHVFIEDDGYVTIIAFADDEFVPSKSIILQIQHEYDEQDKKLGLDAIHIQVGDNSRAIYGGINSIRISDRELSIFLDGRASKELKVEKLVNIRLVKYSPEVIHVLSVLEKLAKKEGIPVSK